MTVLIIIAKVFLSVLLAGLVLGGVFNVLKPSNPAINDVIQRVAGILSLGLGLAGLYFTWFVWA
jgi:hypothetical protein